MKPETINGIIMGVAVAILSIVALYFASQLQASLAVIVLISAGVGLLAAVVYGVLSRLGDGEIPSQTVSEE